MVGDVGDLGDRVEGDLDEDDSEGESGGPRGEQTGEKSSLGLRSILIVGGPPSTDLERFPPFGDGDRDRDTKSENPGLGTGTGPPPSTLQVGHQPQHCTPVNTGCILAWRL